MRTRSKMTGSRRRKESRVKRILLPLICLMLAAAAIILLVFGCIYFVKRMGNNSNGEQMIESSRSVIPENLPGDKGSVPFMSEQTESLSEGKTAEDKAWEAKTPEEILSSMTLEEKVAQMFIITPESLTGVDMVYAAGTATKTAFDQYPVGGLVYFKDNLKSPDQVKKMLENSKKFSMDRLSVPLFTSVDEEGGTVARVGSQTGFSVDLIDNMSVIGASGDKAKAYQAGKTIGIYLEDLGFNLDYAPVADVWTNPENQVVAKRSFGTDAKAVSAFALEAAKGLEEQGVSAVLKHYPGHGGTEGDTHEGYAYTDKTLEELKANELIPFQDGIAKGIDFIMVGHIAVPKVTGDNTPSTLSGKMVNEILRGQMGYGNIIITDAMNMGAVIQSYSSEEAAVNAIQAGVDIILMPEDFHAAYEGVLNAVNSGAISKSRIDESVLRILNVKLRKIS